MTYWNVELHLMMLSQCFSLKNGHRVEPTYFMAELKLEVGEKSLQVELWSEPTCMISKFFKLLEVGVNDR